MDTGWIHRVRPDSDGMIGGMAGLDLKNRKIIWSERYRASGSSAILATAGGLILEGSRDRWFRASDSATGAKLWQIRLDGVPNSFPISFSVDGIQYIAVTAGGGGHTCTLSSSWKKFCFRFVALYWQHN